MFISDSSCNRKLYVSCGFIFPPVFPVLLRTFTGMYESPSFGVWCLEWGFFIIFPVFMSKPCSYSTSISEDCVF